MKIWVLMLKHNDKDFIHAQCSTHSSLRSAVEEVRQTPVYSALSVVGQIDVDNELMIDGVVEIADYTFMIAETELR